MTFHMIEKRIQGNGRPQSNEPINGGRWIWRTSQGPYIRAKHGPIGVELDRINQQNEQQNGK